MTLQATDFDFIQKIVFEQSAIVLDVDKQYLVESKLWPLAEREGFSSIKDLIGALRSNGHNRTLVRKIVNAMTNNETLFFRDVHPFEMLKRHVLPDIIKKRTAEKKLQIWSAACSTGQEPYTIAMILREYFPEIASWKVRFQATDICTDVLARAQEGRFSQLEVNRGLPASLLVKYFTRQGLDWQVNPEIRKMIEFSEINLSGIWPLVPGFDIILMRNVLIYFNVETKKSILNKVRQFLSPDGYFFLGGAEATFNLDDRFERVQVGNTSCYKLR